MLASLARGGGREAFAVACVAAVGAACKTFDAAMLQQIKLHTFKTDGEWEAVDSYWGSPFYFWEKSGVRVTPPVPVRVRVFRSVLDESDDGRAEIGGFSSMFVQVVEARGPRGQTVRVEIGEPLEESSAEDGPSAP